MTEPEIRTASVDDAPQLIAFNCAMARETEDLELDPDTVTAGVRALFEYPERGFYVVADAGARLAGSLMVTTEWSDWRDGLFWWIQSVYVRPEHRRRGVYRALYRFVHDLAGKRPEVCGFRLYVEQDNRRAQKTYRSLGMNRTRYLVYEASTREPGVREP
ncbi:MAG: N-acetyltransferase [Arenicellales bacterium]